MTDTDPIGGKRLSAHDRLLLKKLANGHTIRSKRIFPFPSVYDMVGPEPVQVNSTDVGRLAMRGWITVTNASRLSDVAVDEYLFGITQKGTEVLVSGVVVEPLEQGRLV